MEKLIRQRDNTNDMAKVAKLSAEIRALRAELKPPESPTAPTPTPPTDDPPPVPDTVDDAEAPATVPPPDDTDDAFVSPFTGAPGTGFDGASLIPAPAQAMPKCNQRVYAYINSLPRGEQRCSVRTYVIL